MRDRIYITKVDSDKLTRLIAGRRASFVAERDNLEKLEQELDRAEIVEEAALPPHIVTMNSEVRLKDLDSEAIFDYTLIFPNHPRPGNCISVLAPVGTALLGYGVGDVIEWPVPKGIRRLQILDVVYQPEAAHLRDREVPVSAVR